LVLSIKKNLKSTYIRRGFLHILILFFRDLPVFGETGGLLGGDALPESPGIGELFGGSVAMAELLTNRSIN
jgi:hypothetical protein